MNPTASSDLAKIPKYIARKLGYYVYLLVNPLDGRVFYVGKGKGNRALSHLKMNGHAAKRKARVIRQIRSHRQQPRIEILAHGLKNAETAFRVEAAAIDLLGIPNLTNEIRGLGGVKYARMPLRDVVATLQRKQTKVRVPAVLIRVNRLYRYNMPDNELYDATRGSWRINPRRARRARYAFAVYDGVVREVYSISDWLPAGSTFSAQDPHGHKIRNRWEFVGTFADDKLRGKYRDRYVGDYFRRGAQNPIAYVNIK